MNSDQPIRVLIAEDEANLGELLQSYLPAADIVSP